MMIPCALILSSCGTSQNFNSYGDIPDLPASVKSGGQVTPLPKDVKDLGPAESKELFVKVRRNELRQARAVRATQEWHKQLVKRSNGK